jgi:hypothetical protein
MFRAALSNVIYRSIDAGHILLTSRSARKTAPFCDGGSRCLSSLVYRRRKGEDMGNRTRALCAVVSLALFAPPTASADTFRLGCGCVMVPEVQVAALVNVADITPPGPELSDEEEARLRLADLDHEPPFEEVKYTIVCPPKKPTITVPGVTVTPTGVGGGGGGNNGGGGNGGGGNGGGGGTIDPRSFPGDEPRAVPEPGVAGLMLAAGSAVLLRRRYYGR